MLLSFTLSMPLICVITKNQSVLTGSDKLRLAGLAVAFRADRVHIVCVVLTAACISEVAGVVHRPALCHLPSAVHRCGYVVEGVVCGLPAKDDSIAGTVVKRLQLSWSTRNWAEEHNK